MNTNVLQKCLAELNKDKPNIDKVIGMIETMIEMGGNQVQGSQQFVPPQVAMVNGIGLIPDMEKEFPVIDGKAQEAEQLAKMYGGGKVAQI